MSNFPGEYNTLDTFAFRAAVEAVIGVTLRGEQANQETVNAWLETAVDPEIPSRQVRGRAMYFAQRMFDGPFPPDGP
jgi:hypothetical protein